MKKKGKIKMPKSMFVFSRDSRKQQHFKTRTYVLRMQKYITKQLKHSIFLHYQKICPYSLPVSIQKKIPRFPQPSTLCFVTQTEVNALETTP